MASTLFEGPAPSARLVAPRARAAPTHPRASPEQLGSLRWPQEPASGRPKVEDSPLPTTRSWGTDNQIIASVQTLLDQSAAAMGRSWPLEWKENLAVDDQRSRTGALKKRLKVFRNHMLKSGKVPLEDGGHLLIVCDREESGGHLRLLQQQFGQELQCEVLIGNGQLETWLNEVEGATRGVVLLQTKSVLRNPVRLLQLFGIGDSSGAIGSGGAQYAAPLCPARRAACRCATWSSTWCSPAARIVCKGHSGSASSSRYSAGTTRGECTYVGTDPSCLFGAAGGN